MLCPGPVDTEFNDVANCHFNIKPITAEFCAKAGIDGMFQKKMIIIPENKIKALSAIVKIVPRNIVLGFTKRVQEKKIK